MNPGDEQTIRRLHSELGSLEISPPPVTAVTRRGKAIRARRRALAGGCAAVVAVAVLAGRLISAPGPAPARVTLRTPNASASGGVFASGTADGKPWRLAVRNINADPGTRWCLPAVMFNGRDGDVLFKTGSGPPSFGNPAILTQIPGFPGIRMFFTQVGPGATQLVATFTNGTMLAVRPVRVSACGQRFNLAGFAFADSRGAVSTLDSGPGEALSLSFARNGPGDGIWQNTDNSRADVAASRATNPIGAGTVNGATWRIKTALGLYGQCYTVTARARGTSARAQECLPVAAPPSAISLDWVPSPDGIGGLSGYAGLVNPRTAKVVVGLTNGTIPPARPIIVAGRAYLAFAIPPGCQVTRLSLFDAAGQMFASTATLPPAR